MQRPEAPMPDVMQVARDADWLAHRYDPGHDAIHFRHTPRAEHRAATFLTDEYLPADAGPVVLRRDQAVAAAAPAGQIHFIFHSAFCCSTMLTRAFDLPGVAMGLKEPAVLNDLIGWLRRGGPPSQVARVLDDALALLARPFAPGEATIVKPSNVANGLMPVMLAMRPDARALLLRAPLPVYLNSIARKGMTGRLWARTLLTALAREGRTEPLGFDTEALLGLTDLQAAAVGWLVQQQGFAALAATYPDRVRTLDSESLIERPAEAIAALAMLFSLDIGDDAAVEIAGGPAFRSHSKTGALFDAGDRAREGRDGALVHAEEVERVIVWADAVAHTSALPAAAGLPLLP